MSENIILAKAKHYAENGFHVFPVHKVNQSGGCSCSRGDKCTNIGKHPAISGWPERATKGSKQLEQWFDKSYKGYNIGLLMGSDFVTLDVDVKDESGKNGYDKLDALEAELGELPKDKNAQSTPTGGRHYVYRTVHGIGRHVTKDTESPFYGLDVLGGPSFIVASPSCTNKGAYQWGTGDLPQGHDIPVLPAAWERRLADVASELEASGRERTGKMSYNGVWQSLPERDNNFGVDDNTFEEIRNALTWIPASGWEQPHSWFKIIGAIKNAANDRRGLDLAVEWSGATNDQGEQAYNHDGDDMVAYSFNRASDPTDAELNDSSTGTIFWAAAKFGYPNNGVPKYAYLDSDGFEVAEFKCANLADAGQEANLPDAEDLVDADLVDEEFFAQYARERIPAPKCMTDGTAMVGVLRDIQTYIESNNASPQPALAAMSALTTLSTMTRRTYVGCSRLKYNRMNLMAIGVAPSGGGKDASLKGGPRILRACGLNDSVGQDSKSGTAYQDQTAKAPNILYAQDEIGKWFQYQRGSASHADTIKTFFLKVFTSSDDEAFNGLAYAPSAKADNINEIPYPHVNLYGVSTPDTFFETLDLEDMLDGLIGRMLVVEALDRPQIVQALKSDTAALDAILDFQTQVETAREPTESNLQGFGVENPKEVQIDDAAFELLEAKGRAHREKTMEQLDQYRLAEAYARWLELANKVACLMAIARDPVNPVVGILEARFAAEIVDYSCAKWVTVFKAKTADTAEGKTKQRMIQYLTDNPTVTLKDAKSSETRTGCMTLGVLRNRLSVDKVRFDSALDSLTEGKMVVVEGKKVWLKANGKPEVD